MTNHDDDYVGYGCPPREHRFKRGVSGNPNGRPPRPALDASQIVAKVYKGPTAYHENGEEKVGTLEELILRSFVKRALEGDVSAADTLLQLCIEADRYGDPGTEQILVEDWLPDHADQTGEQKTSALTQQADAAPSEWWAQEIDKQMKRKP